MSHFVAYIFQFQEIIVYKIPPGGVGSIASLRSIYLIFPNVVGFQMTPFSTYILSETRNYVYMIFCANTIISSATRHDSNISLASTNNI